MTDSKLSSLFVLSFYSHTDSTLVVFISSWIPKWLPVSWACISVYSWQKHRLLQTAFQAGVSNTCRLPFGVQASGTWLISLRQTLRHHTSFNYEGYKYFFLELYRSSALRRPQHVDILSRRRSLWCHWVRVMYG